MKKLLIMLVTCMCIAFIGNVNVMAEGNELPTENEVYRSLINYQSVYPEGTSWGDYEQGKSQGKYRPISMLTNFGCAAFACELQDAAFNNEFVHRRYDYKFDDIRVGDILRMNGDSHSVIVCEKILDYIVVAEGNFNSSVHWGRIIPKSVINSNSLTYVDTRWPEGGLSYNNFYYKDNGDKTATITGIKAYPDNGLLIVPQEINGLTVTKIGKSAFFYATNKSMRVFLPDTVTEFEDYALYGAFNANVVFGSGIEKFGKCAVKNANVTLPSPQKEGYTFAGWFDENNEEVTNERFMAGGFFESGIESSMHATWKAGAEEPKNREIFIIFTANNEVINYNRASAKPGSEYSTKITKTLQDGFSGWELYNIKKEDATVLTDKNIKFTMPNSWVILLAHYNEEGYVIVEEPAKEPEKQPEKTPDNNTEKEPEKTPDNNTEKEPEKTPDNNTEKEPEKIPDNNTPGIENGWETINGKSYWYENSVKQGTYTDPKGVMGDGTVRGREIYDPGTNGWYWLDACYEGAKAINKEVWMPYIYQGNDNWDDAEIEMNANNSHDMKNQVIKAIKERSGKWVRYDAEGKMYKSWYTVTGADSFIYPTQVGNTYYYDPMTGLMAKGNVKIDGITYHFDEITGVLLQ